jgi:hypothetical protein
MYEGYVNEMLSIWQLKMSDIKGDIKDKWLIYIRCVMSYSMFIKMSISDKELAQLFEVDFEIYKRQMTNFKSKHLKIRYLLKVNGNNKDKK